ncbi:MAG: class I SAM-dependent methyltransferase [Phycisphaerae bacterium]|nr:class I SAM-dependent methyltransferase [Phycisphaerales bacterium]
MQCDLTHDIQKVASYFGERLERFGAGISALDYGSQASQQARFNVLIDACDYQGKQVLDVGCGLGDFGALLAEQVPSAQYTGIDICEGMVKQARQRGFEAHHMDILSDPSAPSADIVIANGIFYLLEGDCERKMQALISRMYGLARETLIFTSLSNWHDIEDDDEFRADPMKTLQFCRTLSPFLCLRHDYLPHDFCISIRRKQVG